ncbi:hypothetical protein ACSLBF_01365 [Pseudoalteromonas sp. T1lg65]|uniref:hypothetical protein n=1 Tax=Pseudoalteromonas sp. T1lg65 TaxID=2077101 RepID=UPI003F7AE188
MRALLIIMALILSGCSKNTIHIYEVGLKPDSKQQLINELEARGINYHFTDLPVPERYDGAHLNVHPLELESKQVYDLKEIVASLGFKYVEIEPFNKENHRYTPGNIGLYLVQNRQAQQLPEVLFADNCDSDELKITFKPSGKWQLIDSNQHGTWQFEMGYLTLFWYEEGNKYPYRQAYEQSDEMVNTFFGPKPAKRYTRIDSFKKPVSIMNCDLQVILAE